MQDEIIKEIFRKMPTTVPSMPTVVVEAFNLIENPKSNINSLSKIITKDMALTTEILKIVNSAYYGFPSQITSVNRAMALLGMNKIKSLIMGIAVKSMIMSNGGKSLWEHSIKCAVGCQILSKSIDNLDPDDAFIIGLLHDIGKVILGLYNKDACLEISKLVKIGADGLQAEEIMFGTNHTEIGMELIDRWKLPKIIKYCARYHHSPVKCEDRNIIGAVYIADKVCQDYYKFPIVDLDILDSFDFEISDPLTLRETILEQSKPIIEAFSK